MVVKKRCYTVSEVMCRVNETLGSAVLVVFYVLNKKNIFNVSPGLQQHLKEHSNFKESIAKRNNEQPS